MSSSDDLIPGSTITSNESNLDVQQNSISSGNNDLVITSRCYLKLLMHALRYPHTIVNGFLIMEKRKRGANKLIDCIPLFHSGHGLTPMLEVALNQVSEYLHKNTNSVIGGYYQANDNFHELPHPVPNVFAEKIFEKIHEYNSDSVLIMLSDFNLAFAIDEPEKLTSPLFMFNYIDGKLKLKNQSTGRGFQLENSENVFEAIQDLVFKKRYHLNLVDFDTHLENTSYDWRNLKINGVIDNFGNTSTH